MGVPAPLVKMKPSKFAVKHSKNLLNFCAQQMKTLDYFVFSVIKMTMFRNGVYDLEVYFWKKI